MSQLRRKFQRKNNKSSLGGGFRASESLSPLSTQLRGTSIVPSVRRNLRVAYTHTTGSVASIQLPMLLNSGKDPLQAMSAVQPNLWDQITAMYSTYTVLGVDYRISLLSGPNDLNFMFLVPNSANSLPSYTMDNLEAYPLSNGVMNKATETRVPIITGHFDVAKYLGYKSADSMSDQNWALVTDDPIDQLWGLLCLGNIGGGSAAWKIHIELNLHCLFENPKQVVDA